MELVLSPVKIEQRSGDGNLLPEVRKEKLVEVENYLSQVGHLNVYEVAKGLNITWETAKSLIDEIVAGWSDNHKDRVKVQIRYFEKVLTELEKDQMTYKINPFEKVKFKAAIFTEINKLAGLIDPDAQHNSLLYEKELVNFAIWGSVSPKTRKIVEQVNAAIGNDPTGDDSSS